MRSVNTGTYALYGRTHVALMAGAGLVFLLLLAALWALVAAHSLRQCILTMRNTLTALPATMDDALSN